MDECNILNEIPMFKDKRGYEFDGNFSEFRVNILNSGLRPKMFKGNPRVKGIINKEEVVVVVVVFVVIFVVVVVVLNVDVVAQLF